MLFDGRAVNRFFLASLGSLVIFPESFIAKVQAHSSLMLMSVNFPARLVEEV